MFKLQKNGLAWVRDEIEPKGEKREREKRLNALIFFLFFFTCLLVGLQVPSEIFCSRCFILFCCCCCLQWRFIVIAHKDSDFVVIVEFWGDFDDGWWVYSDFHLSVRGICESMINGGGDNLWWKWWCQFNQSKFW